VSVVSDCFGGLIGRPCWRCNKSAVFMLDIQPWCWECLELVNPAAFETAKQARKNAIEVFCSDRKID